MCVSNHRFVLTISAINNGEKRESGEACENFFRNTVFPRFVDFSSSNTLLHDSLDFISNDQGINMIAI